MSMAGKVEQNRPPSAFLFAPQRLVDSYTYGMRRLGGGWDAFRARELQGRLKRAQLRDCYRLDEALVVELAHERGHAVIAKATSVHRRRHERMAEGVHFHQRGHADHIAEVVHILALRQRRTGSRLDRNDA